MTGFDVIAWLEDECNARGLTDSSTRGRLRRYAADAFYVKREGPDEIRAELARSLDALGFERPAEAPAAVDEDVPPAPVPESIGVPDDSDIPF